MSEGSINVSSYSQPVQRLWEKMASCTICPHNCKVNRLEGQIGYCGIGSLPKVSSASSHFGEEDVLVGTGGSGTVFFAGCNLRCIFCQNYDISQLRHGQETNIEKLAEIMLELQNYGCSNINLVTPTHIAAPAMAAVEEARERGLKLSIVYNTGGYDSVETLKLLDGFVDIYMPDMKYFDPKTASELSGAADYPEINRQAVKEMHRQVGDLVIKDGIAVKGLLIRHLVLPNRLAGSFEIIDFLAEKISISTTINVMDQYHPCYKAAEDERINRYPAVEEISEVRQYAKEKGLNVLK